MCDQHFRQVPKPLGSPGVPWLDSYKASSVGGGGASAPQVGTGTCLQPAHRTGKFNYLPDWWQEGLGGALKELRVSESYWAGRSGFQRSYVECIMSQ